MKPNKGFITVLMMVLISISLSTFSRAAFDTFSDVPNDSPFHESIFYLAERGIVCGEGNGRYVPDAPVTVRQWATMLCRALGDADPLNYREDMCQLLEESLEESPKKFLAFHLLTLRLQHRRSLKTS